MLAAREVLSVYMAAPVHAIPLSSVAAISCSFCFLKKFPDKSFFS
jgi:hypothetical protein